MEPENKQKLLFTCLCRGTHTEVRIFWCMYMAYLSAKNLYLLLYRQETENKNLSGGKR